MANLNKSDYLAIRYAVAAIPSDVSTDAVGSLAPKLDDMFAPRNHAAALDPATPIVIGSRGTGKSFWSGVLGQDETRGAAALAYPNLRLDKTSVEFGFTGIGGPKGITKDTIDNYVTDESRDGARAFWWATILKAAEQMQTKERVHFDSVIGSATIADTRSNLLEKYDAELQKAGRILLVVFDALDTVAYTWPRRRMLTIALLEVVWMMRAYQNIKVKLFLRNDQFDDDGLQFVELPKLRAGAVRLVWLPSDLYGLLFSRLAISIDVEGRLSFGKLLQHVGVETPSREKILSRKWSILNDVKQQSAAMGKMAGQFMASGPNGYKKGRTYDWPIKHLSDAFNEVTPRSFIELMISASRFGNDPTDRVITPEGIRHGLRSASKTRVDQLHQEFPWIKGVLAPLDGLLLPATESSVYKVWMRAKTIREVMQDAKNNGYLPPFGGKTDEKELYEAMKNIGVMSRRKDGRLDMPDLFRVAAKLLKKGATAPLG